MATKPQSGLEQLKSIIRETEKGIAMREELMRQGHRPIDMEIARVRLNGVRKALQRLQGKL